MKSAQDLGAIITDSQRIAHLEQKVESLELSIADLRCATERLHELIGEHRLDEIRMAVQSSGLDAESPTGDRRRVRFIASAASL